MPWVTIANHLGYTLHQKCTMEVDARANRMEFITSSSDIRDMFGWAHPLQVLQAMKVYCTSFYGCMLYDLYCEESNRIFRSWNTAAKLAWSVPRSTFTFLVEQVLTGDLTSVRADILTRYASFLQCLTGVVVERSGSWPAQQLVMADALLEVMLASWQGKLDWT